MPSARRSVRARLLIPLVPVVLLAGALGFAPSRPSGDLTAPGSGAQGPDVFVPAGTERIDVGEGARAAAIFRRTEADDRGPVVVFLHGWAAVDPRRYGRWIRHLVSDGASVVYPVYQIRPFVTTNALLGNVIESVRLALARLPKHGRLIVVGHSAGGALAADLAASAEESDLPSVAAVLSIYPGRDVKGVRQPIPRSVTGRIPRDTKVIVLIGERDNAVGDVTGREIVARNRGIALTIVTDDSVDDHSAPRRSDRVARRTFWAPLDRLIAATR